MMPRKAPCLTPLFKGLPILHTAACCRYFIRLLKISHAESPLLSHRRQTHVRSVDCALSKVRIAVMKWYPLALGIQVGAGVFRWQPKQMPRVVPFRYNTRYSILPLALGRKTASPYSKHLVFERVHLK